MKKNIVHIKNVYKKYCLKKANGASRVLNRIYVCWLTYIFKRIIIFF